MSEGEGGFAAVEARSVVVLLSMGEPAIGNRHSGMSQVMAVRPPILLSLSRSRLMLPTSMCHTPSR